MNKSLFTNLAAIGLIVGGYFSPWYSPQILSAGIFALSGAMTNWLAVHMLFERVPLMYGSGVIPLRFKELKRGIKDLVMEQFFQEENVARFLDRNAATLASNSRLAGFSDLMDYDGVFDTVKSMVLDSGFGGLLSMFGGAGALEKYRPMFRQQGLHIVRSQVSKPQFRKKIREKLNDPALRSELIASLESLVEDRLKELTPVMVKEMMQRMIRKHLGWLVVWGGIFGALIGVIVSFFGL